MILVLQEYTSHDCSAPTPRPDNTSSRRGKEIFRRWRMNKKNRPSHKQKNHMICLWKCIPYDSSEPTLRSRNSPPRKRHFSVHGRGDISSFRFDLQKLRCSDEHIRLSAKHVNQTMFLCMGRVVFCCLALSHKNSTVVTWGRVLWPRGWSTKIEKYVSQEL